eukprot:CAMPEP_0202441550 /NCGR_PEP_ID=MMETSP1360-20130828/1097_1 /ASSEMBLY_ACC=CAM_ASM_000848 /TAXON_ID=515479 /ORGANISM="Licmophora paradoxa, Strain CCMP2313" /LENGTH=296 /DNA_ID=CAMNT_0049056595 /DNA_START=20 /DNA_END=910 /DNA_ORIENTATION=+
MPSRTLDQFLTSTRRQERRRGIQALDEDSLCSTVDTRTERSPSEKKKTTPPMKVVRAKSERSKRYDSRQTNPTKRNADQSRRRQSLPTSDETNTKIKPSNDLLADLQELRQNLSSLKKSIADMAHDESVIATPFEIICRPTTKSKNANIDDSIKRTDSISKKKQREQRKQQDDHSQVKLQVTREPCSSKNRSSRRKRQMPDRMETMKEEDEVFKVSGLSKKNVGSHRSQRSTGTVSTAYSTESESSLETFMTPKLRSLHDQTIEEGRRRHSTQEATRENIGRRHNTILTQRVECIA